MKMKIVEWCDVEGNENGETEGARIVYYDSPKDTLLKALEDYVHNFDFDNIHDTYDEFDGACLDSTIIEVAEISEFPKVM